LFYEITEIINLSALLPQEIRHYCRTRGAVFDNNDGYHSLYPTYELLPF
jgi:hypothetical protein